MEIDIPRLVEIVLCRGKDRLRDDSRGLCQAVGLVEKAYDRRSLKLSKEEVWSLTTDVAYDFVERELDAIESELAC